jgi:hypothetical protein
VGAPEIRDFCGAVVVDRAIKGVFITTSDFTAQAKEFAAQTGIELINLSKLLQLFETRLWRSTCKLTLPRWMEMAKTAIRRAPAKGARRTLVTKAAQAATR